MKKKTLLFTMTLLALIVIGVLVYQNSFKKNADNKIGVILSLTGKGASYGNRSLNGIKIAVDELNSRDFFKKNKIVLVTEDSKSNANNAVMAFEKITTIDNASIVIGMVLSDEVLACAKLANEREVVILSPGAGSIAITEAGPYIYRNRESAYTQADAIAKACYDLNKTEVAILYSNAANGISYKDAFKKSLRKYNGNISIEIGFNEGLNDYQAEIERVLQSKPNAIYLAGVDREIGLIIKQAAELKNNVQLFASAGAVTPKLLEIAGKGAEGLITVSESFDPTDKAVKESVFVKNYLNKYGELPEWVAANSYEATMLIGKLIEGGCKTGKDFKHALDTVSFQSFSGTLTFDNNGDVIKSTRLLKVENGEFVKYSR